MKPASTDPDLTKCLLLITTSESKRLLIVSFEVYTCDRYLQHALFHDLTSVYNKQSTRCNRHVHMLYVRLTIICWAA